MNAIAPGPIATDFSREVYEANPQLLIKIAQNTALGRLGQAEDIGPVIAFLCSEAAAWVNVRRLGASGGQMIRRTRVWSDFPSCR
ncbi:SDR family oxidoreductase [Variovorax sp. J22P271]|uniref:SDR family oxidoreductase n=1 Tax=Variovorax davisae TaxID=3053515 RepID=UPI002579039C|nr:SDR family oxidoreductase [Variovorax sp. J22P271]MDM0032493.1 SDR family oxidoreductase [Variovorax sp. J22P271]